MLRLFQLALPAAADPIPADDSSNRATPAAASASQDLVAVGSLLEELLCANDSSARLVGRWFNNSVVTTTPRALPLSVLSHILPLVVPHFRYEPLPRLQLLLMLLDHVPLVLKLSTVCGYTLHVHSPHAPAPFIACSSLRTYFPFWYGRYSMVSSSAAHVANSASDHS